jgi:hypothetical protein
MQVAEKDAFGCHPLGCPFSAKTLEAQVIFIVAGGRSDVEAC